MFRQVRKIFICKKKRKTNRKNSSVQFFEHLFKFHTPKFHLIWTKGNGGDAFYVETSIVLRKRQLKFFFAFDAALHSNGVVIKQCCYILLVYCSLIIYKCLYLIIWHNTSKSTTIPVLTPVMMRIPMCDL